MCTSRSRLKRGGELGVDLQEKAFLGVIELDHGHNVRERSTECVFEFSQLFEREAEDCVLLRVVQYGLLGVRKKAA